MSDEAADAADADVDVDSGDLGARRRPPWRARDGASGAPGRAGAGAPGPWWRLARASTLAPVPASALSSHARAHLKALAHPLSPLVLIGAEGVSAGVIQAVSVALEDHELIKVRLTQSFEGDRHEAAETLAPEVGAALVQVIGRTLVLYRRRCRDLPKRPRIELPA